MVSALDNFFKYPWLRCFVKYYNIYNKKNYKLAHVPKTEQTFVFIYGLICALKRRKNTKNKHNLALSFHNIYSRLSHLKSNQIIIYLSLQTPWNLLKFSNVLFLFYVFNLIIALIFCLLKYVQKNYILYKSGILI